MIGWKLPQSITVQDIEYQIRADYLTVLEVLVAMNDQGLFTADMEEQEKNLIRTETMLIIMLPEFEVLPTRDWGDASKELCDFIDCGLKDDGKTSLRLMDWEQDASLIAPAINKVAHTDVRTGEPIHWWTFMGYYMEIGESLFGQVLSIRKKIKKGKKLEKWEREFQKENKHLIDLKVDKYERSEEEKEALRNLLGLKGSD